MPWQSRRKREPGVLRLAEHVPASGTLPLSGGGNHQDPGPLVPCPRCVGLVARLGLRPDVFAPGTPLDRGASARA
jgi:hypothetical protein